MKRTNVLTIGGGHGQSVVLRALMTLLVERELTMNVTGVVPHTDSGGSTGKIIQGSHMLPMGDWLKCLLAVSDPSDDPRSHVIKMIAKHRLKADQCPAQAGHTAGNFMLAALLSMHKGDVRATLRDASILFGNWERFPIWPACERPAMLRAIDVHGRVIDGEHVIDTPDRQPRQLERVELVDSLPALPEVIDAIRAADAMIFGPGDLFTSVLPGVIVDGVAPAIQANENALKIFVLNVMTKSTETWRYPLSRIVQIFERDTGVAMTHLVVNTATPDEALLGKYREEGKELAIDDLPKRESPDGAVRWDRRMILRANLIGGDLAHHDPRTLANVLQPILQIEQ